MKITAVKKNNLVTYWRRGSKSDFDTASEIAPKTRRYTSALVYMHLSIEKALKTLFVKKKAVAAPYTHNLLRLAAKCDLEISPAIEKTLVEINEYNLESRYPDEKFSLEKQASKKFTVTQLKKTS